MEAGQKAKHLLSGEVLTVKKVNGNVVTCFCAPFKSNGITIDVQICLKSNIIPC